MKTVIDVLDGAVYADSESLYGEPCQGFESLILNPFPMARANKVKCFISFYRYKARNCSDYDGK
jgi:hypothetical protein